MTRICEHYQFGTWCVRHNLLTPHRGELVVFCRYDQQRSVQIGQQIPRIVLVGLVDVLDEQAEVECRQVLEVWKEVFAFV